MVVTKTIKDVNGNEYVAVCVNGKEVKNTSQLVTTTNEKVLDILV